MISYENKTSQVAVVCRSCDSHTHVCYVCSCASVRVRVRAAARPRARRARQARREFFMSTRYGKRSDSSGGAGGGAGGGGPLLEGAAQALVCEYTGVWALYRCRHKPPLYHKRSAEETMERYEE
ncbi:hypothetical protein HF086_012348 [Spodoptera exigua]|uniref:Uncharacterized protein n=1 Tax=Spodoptera exigua TaxID=7107 RepID=A0A922M9L1_SPOEX|nr:hypothetical protein HF086_012348 [Spodoptera exigua]